MQVYTISSLLDSQG